MTKKFMIEILFNQRRYRLGVVVHHFSTTFDFFVVVGKNRAIVLRSNKPRLMASGLKAKRIDWKLMRGQAPQNKVLEEIIEQLERYYRQPTTEQINEYMKHLRKKP